MNDAEDLYEVLGVLQTATPEEIKRAYFQSVRKFRPNEHPEAFQRFNEANLILGDPHRRDQYDQMRRYGQQVQVLIDQANTIRKDEQKAIRFLKHAVLLAPDLNPPRILLAGEFMRVQEYQNAEAELRWLVGHTPKDASLRYQLGRCLLHQERFDEAEAELRQAIEFNPHYHDAFVLLSQIYQGAQQSGKAVAFLEKAIAVDGLENFADFDALLRLLGLYVSEKNPGSVARIGQRIQTVLLDEDEEKIKQAMTYVWERTLEFSRAGDYAAASEILKFAQHPKLTDPALTASIAKLSLVLPLMAEADRIAEDELVCASIKAYLHAHYFEPSKHAAKQRIHIAQSNIQTEITANPRLLLRTIDYLRREYPLVSEDQSEFLRQLYVRAGGGESVPAETVSFTMPVSGDDKTAGENKGFFRRLFRLNGH